MAHSTQFWGGGAIEVILIDPAVTVVIRFRSMTVALWSSLRWLSCVGLGVANNVEGLEDILAYNLLDGFVIIAMNLLNFLGN